MNGGRARAHVCMCVCARRGSSRWIGGYEGEGGDYPIVRVYAMLQAMERISASVVCRSTVECDGARVGETAQPMVWVATGLPGKQVNDSGCYRGIGLAWVRSARVTLLHGRACAALPPLEGERISFLLAHVRIVLRSVLVSSGLSI